MPIESAAELVQILAGEFKRSGAELDRFAAMTGIPEERLVLLQACAWEHLTIRDIAQIMEALQLDFRTL